MTDEQIEQFTAAMQQMAEACQEVMDALVDLFAPMREWIDRTYRDLCALGVFPIQRSTIARRKIRRYAVMMARRT